MDASDFVKSTVYSESQEKALLGRKEVQGGFDFVYSDICAIRELILKDETLMEKFNWLNGNRFPAIPITDRSPWNMASEDYVKRFMLESFGVLCQVNGVSTDKWGNVFWVMKGVCPFHRRHHRNQHWIINEGKPDGESIVQCFHCSKRFTKVAFTPKAYVAKLNLFIAVGDGVAYPVPRLMTKK